jgi:hypothetical protein
MHGNGIEYNVAGHSRSSCSAASRLRVHLVAGVTEMQGTLHRIGRAHGQELLGEQGMYRVDGSAYVDKYMTMI